MKNINSSNLNENSKESLITFVKNKDTYNSIFDEQEKRKLFFFSKNNLYYGKVDTNNNIVMLKNDKISALQNNVGAIASTIASQAFSDLYSFYEKAKPLINQNSFYYNLKPVSIMKTANASYAEYLSRYNNSFFEFINKSDIKKIKNPKDFFDYFILVSDFFIKIQNLPITRTGFIESIYCKTTSTGLVIDLTSDIDSDKKKYEEYFLDPNFLFFLEAARKFNFLVDKDKPWRLVFNLLDQSLFRDDPIRDCEVLLPDGTIYAPSNAVVLRKKGYFKLFELNSLEDFFSEFYDKSMIGTNYEETSELGSLKNIFIQMYNNFAIPNNKIVYGKENSRTSAKMVVEDRENLYPNELNKYVSNETWLKFLLYLRAIETKQKWNQTEFNSVFKKTLVAYRNYGIRNACNVINYMTRNILDVDKTSTRLIDREDLINKEFSEAESFSFHY